MASLEQEVAQLKARFERLEATVRRLTGGEPEVAPPLPTEPMDQAQLLAWLKAEGLVREPTPEERRLAAEWDALPEEEKQARRQGSCNRRPGRRTARGQSLRPCLTARYPLKC